VKTRSIAAALLVALAPSLVSIPAVAQSDDTTTQEVKARFAEGVTLYDAGQFEAARAKFKQAYALKPLPDILFNLAMSSLKSSHPVEAERDFNKFLRESKDADPGERDAATKGLAEARGKNGHIEVAAPPGTEVYVDNEHIGTAPIADPVPVDPGAHVVKFQGTDNTTSTLSVSVLANQTQPAHFGSSGSSSPSSVTMPPASTTSTPSASSTGEPATPPSSSDNASAGPATPPTSTSVGADTGTNKTNLLAPPKNLTPVFIGAGVAVVGFGLGIAMLIVKGTAQNNADSVAAQIRKQPGTNSNTCNSATWTGSGQNEVPSANMRSACSTLQSDIDNVNTDATVGNIAVGVGIAALVGTAIYWVVATKKDDVASPTKQARAFVSPIIGPRLGGLSIGGTF
jgi:hypothetical protein